MCCLEPRFPGAREGNPSHSGAYRAELRTKSVPICGSPSPHRTLEPGKGSWLLALAHSPMRSGRRGETAAGKYEERHAGEIRAQPRACRPPATAEKPARSKERRVTGWAHPHHPQQTLATVPALRCSCLRGSRLGQQLGRVGSLWCVGGEGQDRKLEKTLALGHILKPLCSNGKLRPGVWGQRKINLGASKA